MPCEVRVRYCVPLSDRCGHEEEIIELDQGSTLEHLLRVVADKHNLDERFLASCFITINGKGVFQLDGWNTELRTGDQIAFLPPLSGG